ncbi:DUF3365 domain-containing protein [Ferriphaselus sp. R-1]|uniref:Tll0287-like domain-containing protein n=1 Tax=Ferriphaselus sp. R-1 TaxID=1485544 RepID=UPI0005522EC0|nr:DUF3365 domain-containing protein [Ferriphaselus sp. R-1]
MLNKLLLSAIVAAFSLPAVAAEATPEAAKAIALPFLKQLAAENQKAVAEGGPESAIQVCKEIAPRMAGEASRKHGLKLSRVSLKVRNPMLGTPDAWEQKVLQGFEARAAKGEKPETIEFSEVVQEPAGKYFRFMKAIALQPGCVSCHGASEQISDATKARLAEDYPYDRATGYAPGQIRGAVSIKQAM